MNGSAREALERLREGNRRFAAHAHGPDSLQVRTRPALGQEQRPFAIILGCSDARVPAEIVNSPARRRPRGSLSYPREK